MHHLVQYQRQEGVYLTRLNEQVSGVEDHQSHKRAPRCFIYHAAQCKGPKVIILTDHIEEHQQICFDLVFSVNLGDAYSFPANKVLADGGDEASADHLHQLLNATECAWVDEVADVAPLPLCPLKEAEVPQNVEAFGLRSLKISAFSFWI